MERGVVLEQDGTAASVGLWWRGTENIEKDETFALQLFGFPIPINHQPVPPNQPSTINHQPKQPGISTSCKLTSPQSAGPAPK